MPSFSKKDPKIGDVTVKTDNPAEIAELKANGFREDETSTRDNGGELSGDLTTVTNTTSTAEPVVPRKPSK